MTKNQKTHSAKKSPRKTAEGKCDDSRETLLPPGHVSPRNAGGREPQSGKPAPGTRASIASRVDQSSTLASDLDEAGQSGDTQGLSSLADADSESVKELVEEGQDFEAMVISGVENAPDPDGGAVRTKEVSEDDVPPEYRDYRENK